MTMRQNNTSKKKAVNLSVNSELLKEAKEFNINLSATFEENLEKKIKEEKEKRWQEENKEAIAAYNKRIEEQGCISDHFRRF